MTEPDRRRIAVGRTESLRRDRCLMVGSGEAVLLLTDEGPRAYVNRCPHNDLPLEGAWIRDGVLTCPHHFWRFDAETGLGMTEPEDLISLEVEELRGEVWVRLPFEAPAETFRERQLRHARSWRRDRP
ncbi:MAG: Rieske (2Fe-2S) protein [Acidimicrobiales bacterium]